MICTRFDWNWSAENLLKYFQSIHNVLLLYLPLGRCVAIHLNDLNFPPKDNLCQVWLNWPSGSGEDENVKVYRQTDRMADDQKIELKI
jgi:hypothetical protein